MSSRRARQDESLTDDLPARAKLLGRVIEHWQAALRETPGAQGWLREQGLDDARVLTALGVGYADGSLVGMADKRTKVGRDVRALGLIDEQGAERFEGCLVFPLALPEIGVVNVYGHHLTTAADVLLPGPVRGVLNVSAFKGEEIVIAGSALDALTLLHAGIMNVTSLVGPEGLTRDHEDLVRRFGPRRAILLFDDRAGGVRSRLEALGMGVVTRVPASDLRTAWRIDREAARSSVRALLSATKEADSGRPIVAPEPGGGLLVTFPNRTWRIRGLTAIGLDRLRVNIRVESGDRVHLDTQDLHGHRSRTRLITELADLFGVNEAAITREVTAVVEVLEQVRVERRREGSSVIEIGDRERDEALRLARAPDLLDRILEDFAKTGFVGERTALTVAHLVSISRLLDDPLGLLVVSRSGAGKSSLQSAVCDFVPEESLARFTRLTGQALFYASESGLAHKVLAIEEDEGAADAAYSLRVLQSAQVLTTATTRADAQTGRLTTSTHTVKGPVAILLSTTAPEALDYETRNRFVQVSIDESAEQTRKILARQREADTLEGVLGRQEAEHVQARQQHLQRLLRPLKVVNPFASKLVYPDGRLQMRREQKKYLALIRTIALLHQHQREVKRARRGEVEIEYIEVTPSDVTLANRLAREVLGRSLDELAAPTRDLLKQLVRMTKARGTTRFTRADIREATGWSDWSLRTHLAHLVEMEYVVVASGRNGKQMAYDLLFTGDPDEDRHWLAGLVEVEGPDLVEKSATL